MTKKDIETLFKAAEEGDLKKFKEILSTSPKSIITQLDDNNNSIIHIATQNNRGSIIAAFEKFIEKHPQIQFNINDMNKFGQTPLDIANLSEQNIQGASIAKALESLSRALSEPLYTSESLRVIRAMQIEDFIHSEMPIKKSAKSNSEKHHIERIF